MDGAAQHAGGARQRAGALVCSSCRNSYVLSGHVRACTKANRYSMFVSEVS